MEIIRDDSGKVKKVALFEAELCQVTGLTSDQLEKWATLFPHEDWGKRDALSGVEKKFEYDIEGLETAKKRAKLLKAGMTTQQIPQIEERGFLDAYALLAEDCPSNITPHMLRSYCVLIVYQNRGQKMLLAEELAKKAGVPEETAKRHIMYLIQKGLLRVAQNPQRWEFSFIPRALNRFLPS